MSRDDVIDIQALLRKSSLPVYHRRESPTQTPADAKEIERSGELWGRARRGSEIRQVQAWRGPLPPGQRGIEFVTEVPEDPNDHPDWARWSEMNPGVGVEGDFAKIPVTVLRNTQT